MTDYLVATVKPWNLTAFQRRTASLPGRWHLVEHKQGLNTEILERIRPRYIFFPHWSWLVPPDILQAAECVCFHMTEVPYGRGGSPLQNLILRGHEKTMVTALRMETELDAGPVYLKRPMQLAGSAQQIFERLAELVYDMVTEIVATEPEPVPQKGEATWFPRRNPEQSRLPTDVSVRELYDHIRMLDAETYPRAFAEFDKLRMEFSDAELQGKSVKASVTLRPNSKDSKP